MLVLAYPTPLLQDLSDQITPALRLVDRSEPFVAFRIARRTGALFGGVQTAMRRGNRMRPRVFPLCATIQALVADAPAVFARLILPDHGDNADKAASVAPAPIVAR